MTVGDLKKRLKLLDDDMMIIITESDNMSWTNIDKIEVIDGTLNIFQETDTLFSQS